MLAGLLQIEKPDIERDLFRSWPVWDTRSGKDVDFVCGFCGVHTSALTVLSAHALVHLKGKAAQNSSMSRSVYICRTCHAPTFITEKGLQFPDKVPGKNFRHLPLDVGNLYSEGQRSFAVGAYTAAAMVLRKLLINLAVNKGADQNLHFYQYIDHIRDSHLVPVQFNDLIDKIRKWGNEANHELPAFEKVQTVRMFELVDYLFDSIYELPGKHAEEAAEKI